MNILRTCKQETAKNPPIYIITLVGIQECVWEKFLDLNLARCINYIFYSVQRSECRLKIFNTGNIQRSICETVFP